MTEQQKSFVEWLFNSSQAIVHLRPFYDRLQCALARPGDTIEIRRPDPRSELSPDSISNYCTSGCEHKGTRLGRETITFSHAEASALCCELRMFIEERTRLIDLILAATGG